MSERITYEECGRCPAGCCWKVSYYVRVSDLGHFQGASWVGQDNGFGWCKVKYDEWCEHREGGCSIYNESFRPVECDLFPYGVDGDDVPPDWCALPDEPMGQLVDDEGVVWQRRLW